MALTRWELATVPEMATCGSVMLPVEPVSRERSTAFAVRVAWVALQADPVSVWQGQLLPLVVTRPSAPVA